MKIMQVMAGAEYGGAEDFFTRLAIALNKTEIEQRVFIGKNKRRATRLKDGGVESTQLRFGGKLDLKTPRDLKRQINDFSPDIVFSWMNRATSMCPSNGDYIHVGRLGGYYNLKYYQKCDHLVANTQDIAKYICNNGWTNTNVHYLPNFVGAMRVKPIDREKYFTPPNAPLILAMGRLHENKAFDILLDAVANLPNFYLWLAGEGPLRDKLENYAIEIGVKPRIRFLGWQENTEELLAAADLFVCPSRHEPLGNVVIEAWAQGIPVVAADSLGPKFLIQHGKNGFLFPVDDAKKLTNYIRRLIDSPNLTADLVSQASSDYAKNFTESIIVDKYLKFFGEIVS
jgi:glycosyltransferase involved in cell wall biosynthesis